MLIELMIVVAIIGILVAIAISAYVTGVAAQAGQVGIDSLTAGCPDLGSAFSVNVVLGIAGGNYPASTQPTTARTFTPQ